MPVKLEWNSSHTVLIATYSGPLTAADFERMCKERAALLDARDDPVILVADTQQMEDFRDRDSVKQPTNIITHPKVRCVLLVLKSSLYQTLIRPIIETAQYDHPVRFFADIDAALDQAQAFAN
jgi:hypothetical protein